MARKKSVDKSKFADRDKLLKEKYGISEKQWDMLYERCKGKCPVCGTKLFKYHEKSGRRAAPVDHCHKSNVVRGLLCVSCNRWRVGRNTLTTAKKVVEYLQEVEDGFDGRDL